MIPFKRMWEDTSEMILKDEVKDVLITEKYKGGFVVEEEGTTEFINKEDFVDFWCKLLCFEEFSKEEAIKQGKLKYVYEIIKNLPYVNESSNVLRLVD